ncbi:hypothetical protein [Bacillus sp. SN10]|uniref:hypothetical protein n=1 Tax=Bacillus sp. SN10 TaxID=2056493 RepID=UPI0012FF3D85|nr:hypothetical protein [Bacillus sp. SN10]
MKRITELVLGLLGRILCAFIAALFILLLAGGKTSISKIGEAKKLGRSRVASKIPIGAG